MFYRQGYRNLLFPNGEEIEVSRQMAESVALWFWILLIFFVILCLLFLYNACKNKIYSQEGEDK